MSKQQVSSSSVLPIEMIAVVSSFVCHEDPSLVARVLSSSDGKSVSFEISRNGAAMLFNRKVDGKSSRVFTGLDALFSVKGVSVKEKEDGRVIITGKGGELSLEKVDKDTLVFAVSQEVNGEPVCFSEGDGEAGWFFPFAEHFATSMEHDFKTRFVFSG